MKYYSKSFWLCMAVAFVAIAPYIVLQGGCFALSNDFSAETIPFGMLINRAYKSENLLWHWGIDLGGNFLENYNGHATSPFVLLQLLFPEQWFPYVIGWINIIKFAVGGLCCSLYLRRHLKSETTVILGSVLYIFSSYQCTNIVFQFQDLIAFFALLLWAFEVYVEENKKLPFVLACTLNVSISVASFVGTAIFLIIYYIVIYVLPNVQEKGVKSLAMYAKKGFGCVGLALLGAANVSLFAIPCVINLMGNTRTGEKIPVSQWFFISFQEVLLLVKSFFLPAEPMNRSFSVTDGDWMSNAAYLPVFGVIFGVAYIITKRKDKWKNLMVVLYLMALIPVANSVFYLFTSTPYHRWYHMLLMVQTLITCFVLEDIASYKILPVIRVDIAILIIFVLLVAGAGSIHTIGKFCLSLGYAMSGLAVVTYLKKRKVDCVNGEKRERFVLIICVLVFCMAQLAFTIHEYQHYADNTDIDFQESELPYAKAVVEYLTEIPNSLSGEIGPYRYYFDEGIGYTYYNLAMVNSLPSISSFISNVSNSVFTFYRAIDMERVTMTKHAEEELNHLLGAKYILATEAAEGYTVLREFHDPTVGTVYYMENPNVLPIGFAYDSYITQSEFDHLPKSRDRINAMMDSLVVDDDLSAEIGKVLSHTEDIDSLVRDEEYMQGCIWQKQNDSCTEFRKFKNGFEANYRCDADRYVFFTVPYEKWWHATVNGKEAEITQVNGFMAVKAESGENTISFTYHYTPVKWALILTMAGIVGTVLVAVFEGRKRQSMK